MTMTDTAQGSFVRFPNHFLNFEELGWDEKLLEHRRYVDSFTASRRAAVNSSDGDADVDYLKPNLDVQGAWLIECNHLTTEWGEENLQLKVKRRGGRQLPVGVFDFGIVEGVMHFDTDLSRLPHTNFRGSPEAEGESSQDEDDESEGDVEDYDTKAEVAELKHEIHDLRERLDQSEGRLTATLDALATANDFQEAKGALSIVTRLYAEPSPRPKRKPDSADDHPPDKKRKKQKATQKSSEHPRRMYFLWRGRETSQGEIQIDRNRSNYGHIDFADDDGLSFTGVISGGLFGRETMWRGYKLGSSVPPSRRSWDDYSEEKYEEERVGRWR